MPPAARRRCWVLPEISTKGNSHMLMQDDNSLDIADILLGWIGKHVTAMQ